MFIGENVNRGKKPTKMISEGAFQLSEDILKSQPIEFLQPQSAIQKEMMFNIDKLEEKLLESMGIKDTREQVTNTKEYPYCCFGLVTGKCHG